ncbi:small ubiquitin-related modifier 2-A-like isoform X2 [Myzus persicae]|uniref:small ubiquitin-related modifier 2-A-like isoform X2 n=1 Tax=Myzus persicae TaxID=13164 RepID=UPI000B936D43|nr:small ubiquitin-related modifier 2-A-like isoform X2 [Myzus persicae]
MPVFYRKSVHQFGNPFKVKSRIINMDRSVAPEPGPPIILRVLGPDGSCIRIKMKMLAPFQKLMKIYCKRTGFILEALRFRFDGNVIFESYTPYSMNLSDGDTIEVFQSMVGGTIFLNR